MRALAGRLRDEPPSDPDALYTELRPILFETRSREELKFAIVIVGTYARDEDTGVFRMLARHDEFTLFGAAALCYGADDWVGELLSLIPDLSSGGANEVSQLLLHTRDERVYSLLLRRSAAIGHPLNLPVAWLWALDAGEVDDDLRGGARSILDELTWSFSEPKPLFDYPNAGVAVERFELLTNRASTLDAAYELGRFLEPADDGSADRSDDAPVERIRELSRAIVARPAWHALTIVALASHDRDARARDRGGEAPRSRSPTI